MQNYPQLQAKNTSFLATRWQNSDQIAALIVKAIKESEPAAQVLARNFAGHRPMYQCKMLYTFAKNLFPYKMEPSGMQTAKTLPRIIQDAEKFGGDCKHYTITICSIARALGIPVKARLISQKAFSRNPTHIYAVATIDGKDIVIDPCMKNFGQQARYTYKKDLKIK